VLFIVCFYSARSHLFFLFSLLLDQDKDKKLEHLAALLREQGIDVVSLFSDVGLDVPNSDSTPLPTDSDGKS